MTDTPPVVVIGAGHNGLVAAAYLARAGRRVIVLEASDDLGGTAVTRALMPGVRAPVVAHLAPLLDPRVLKDLALARHGLVFARTQLRSVALNPAGEALVLDDEHILSGPVGAADHDAYVRFSAKMRRFADVLGAQYGRAPPRLAWDRWRDAWPAARLGLDIRRLGREDMREFLRIVTMAIHDLVNEYFDSDLLKGAIVADALWGTKLGSRSGNTVFTYLHRLSGQARELGVALPRGGMGAITEALASSAREAGVDIRVSSRVRKINVSAGRISGVVLESGEVVPAATVLSSADPKQTLLALLGARHLDVELAQRVHHARGTGTTAKLNLVLDGLPRFLGVSEADLGERLLLSPSSLYADEAFNPAKYREYSRAPIMEITVPTVHDHSLAPTDCHVLSAIVQYAPHDLEGGWAQARASFETMLLETLERHAPGIRQQLRHSQLLTPEDLERDFHVTGGHWHQLELSLDQALMLRPVAGLAQYRMPVEGLYLCGAGAHPGGGVMGTAGRNAARVVLEDGA